MPTFRVFRTSSNERLGDTCTISPLSRPSTMVMLLSKLRTHTTTVRGRTRRVLFYARDVKRTLLSQLFLKSSGDFLP